MPSPEAICTQVRAALEHERCINLHRYPIHLRCEDGILTVDGDVEHIVAKKLALELAASVPGVDGLVDRLRVVPTRPMGDGAVRDHVRDALLQEPAFTTFAIVVRDQGRLATIRPAVGTPCGSIEVAVAEGVVTLNGQVPSLSHKRLAGVLAWWVPGSRDVINGLAVEPSEEDSDDEVTDAVRLVLEKDRFIKADQIRVRTRERVVTLEGLVSSATIRDMAEFDAWYVFGVDRVVNRLQVQA
ncbi:MAG TPA: BON domain-containing protein [Candidatus Tectomicrobia bacterium]|nr:BON domain-containing protein [Candidatus Tectomicrobia bacterium]